MNKTMKDENNFIDARKKVMIIRKLSVLDAYRNYLKARGMLK